MSGSQKIPTLADVGRKARQAIAEGIRCDHDIAMMEELGVTQRTVNLLEDGGITKLAELMQCQKEELLELKNFGEKQLCVLFDALSKYHLLV